MNKNEVIIKLNNITKEFDGVVVVDDFNLEVKKGEFVTFLGPSGCGKTTTLRMIAGFEMPTGGEILLNGEDIAQLPPYKRPVNTVFQRYALFPHLDVYENVAFGLKLKKIKDVVTDKKGNKNFSFNIAVVKLPLAKAISAISLFVLAYLLIVFKMGCVSFLLKLSL